MNYSMKIQNPQVLKKRIQKVQSIAQGNTAALTPLKNEVAGYGLAILLRNFKERGKYFGQKWRELRIVTKLFRRKGARGKYKSLKEVEAERHEILMDNGRLRMSFIMGRTGNIKRVQKGWNIEVGSSNPLAQKHHKGFTSMFRMTKDKWDTFDANFAKVLPGAPKSRGTGKRKTKPKKNWNPEYFKTRAMLNKMDGSSRKTPARKLKPDAGLPQRDVQAIANIFDKHLSKLIKQAENA